MFFFIASDDPRDKDIRAALYGYPDSRGVCVFLITRESEYVLFKKKNVIEY